MSYQAKHYNADDVRRLQELVKEGCIVKQEVKDLNDGLNDTVKAIAEEMEIPAGHDTHRGDGDPGFSEVVERLREHQVLEADRIADAP